MAKIKLNNPLKSNLNVKFSVPIYKYVKNLAPVKPKWLG
jgi:hypothetical protein